VVEILGVARTNLRARYQRRDSSGADDLARVGAEVVDLGPEGARTTHQRFDAKGTGDIGSLGEQSTLV
jgi:hypothetical protein